MQLNNVLISGSHVQDARSGGHRATERKAVRMAAASTACQSRALESEPSALACKLRASESPPDAACDPRIMRSKAALREALISLMEERGFDSVTVNDLCQRAGLNRGTFYNHFHDKESLLLGLEDEFLSGIGNLRERMRSLEIQDLVAARLAKRPLPPLVELFEYLRDEGDFLHAVLGPGGDVRFGPRLREAVCEGFIRALLHERYQGDSSAFVGYYISFYAGAYLGVISRWVETGMSETPEEMATISMRLLFIKPGDTIKL